MTRSGSPDVQSERLAAVATGAGRVAVVSGGLAIAGVLAIVPGQLFADGWAWLVWGRELTTLTLDTTDGPSFKPLPVLIAAGLAPFGDSGPQLWITLVRIAWLVSLAAAYSIARQLGGVAAGVLACVCLLVSTESWVLWFAEGYSEPVVIALVLGAIQRHLASHRLQALLLGCLAALGRPEAWVFVVAYGVLLWRQRPALRPVLVAPLLIPLIWLGGDLAGSGSPTTGATRALPDLSRGGIWHWRWVAGFASVRQAATLVIFPVWLGAIAATVNSLRRRRSGHAPGRIAGVLGAGALLWIAADVALGFVPFRAPLRFMAPPAAVLSVLAGVGLVDLYRLARQWPLRVVLIGGLAAVLIGFAVQRVDQAQAQLEREEVRTGVDRSVIAAVEATNARAQLERCGGQAFVVAKEPGLGVQARLSWALAIPLRRVRQIPRSELKAVRHGLLIARGRASAWVAKEAAARRSIGRTALAPTRFGRFGRWAMYRVGCPGTPVRGRGS